MTTKAKPTELIVGAGLGGLVLGALLEKTDIPYTIFERQVSSSGYYSYVIARSTLYNLLLKQVPSHKIHFGKRVDTVLESNDKVTIKTTDGSTFEGDILVGADGAYSVVRQRIYEDHKREGKLPKPDQEKLPYSAICLVGQTGVVDQKDFPEFEKPSLFNTLSKDKPYSWMTMATADNKISYLVMKHLDSSKTTNEAHSNEVENPEWGPQAAQSMCDETRNLPLSIGPKGTTMGDLYDWTPKDLISKVNLEEKVFETWHRGRTVLLGDGAVIAMHDALVIANLLYALPANTSQEIEKAYVEYKAERYGSAIDAFNASQMVSRFMERGIAGKAALFVMRLLPASAFDILSRKHVLRRPQAGFLPPVENKGSLPAEVSLSTEKARLVHKERLGALSI
ncbi:hypothetical protein BGW39_009257 [Mortierella sp. 14UC]|nr:hypothetical protein BGW39_009257 [Mortierella sp. 14UC]